MGNLGKKLKRELIKSPAKGGLLGLVCLIALWYWAPILGDSLTGASNKPQDIRVVKAEETGASDSGLIATAKENVGKAISTVCKWQALAKWLDEDPRAKSAIVPEDHRDPFRRTETSTAEDLIRRIQEEADEAPTKLVAQPETPVEEDIEFSDLNLVLGGTIVGTHFQSATINGNTYWLRNDASENKKGRIIQVPIGVGSRTADESSAQTITLQLVEVYPDYVVLEFQEEKYPLDLKRPRLAIGSQIARHASVKRIDAGDGGQNESTGNLGFIHNVFQWFNSDM